MHYHIINNILSIDTQTQGEKTYTLKAEGCVFLLADFTLPVFHKRKIKHLHRKNLGKKMTIFALPSQPALTTKTLTSPGIQSALSLYSSFDEETGAFSHFFYQFNASMTAHIKKQFELLGLQAYYQDIAYDDQKQTAIITPKETKDIPTDKVDDICSFLFVGSLLYGKWDIQDGTLHAIKLHIPLFGSFLRHQEKFEHIQTYLQSKGIYIKMDILQNENTLIQYTIRDPEFLQWGANIYKSIANIDRISTQDRISSYKDMLDLDVHGIKGSLLKPLRVE